MKIGVVFPQTEIGQDPAMIRDDAQAVGRLALAQFPGKEREKVMAEWHRMRGITHLCVNTMGLGLPGPEEHVKTLERFKRDVSP